MISLPKGYVKVHNIKKGDQVEICYNTEFRGKLIDVEQIKKEFERRHMKNRGGS